MDTQLRNLLADVFGTNPADLTEKTSKDDVASWDSLKQMDLVVSLERAYAISLTIDDIISMQSVAAICSVLKQKGVPLED
ncbi:MAG: acyl carrier protein [Desulfovibrionaceae bacterium]|nr:acyl carrier protein [Desulfovibrionaceae bacterium]